MRLLISGSHNPDFETFKRLVLIADEIAFMDHPSVTLPEWGTIGRDHPMKRYKFVDSPITISVKEPPSGPAEGLYLPYLTADLRSPEFRRVVFEGLHDDGFAWRFIQPEAKHGEELKLGREQRGALLMDPTLPAQEVEDADIKTLFIGRNFGTAEYRRANFKMILVSVSIAVTSTLAVADEQGLVPISDDPTMCKLLGMRLSDRHYVGNAAPPTAGPLAIAVASAVIPDEAMRILTMKDICEYRKGTRDAYSAWSSEINRLATRITDLDPAAVQRELPSIIHGELQPRLLAHKNELRAARDRMFGDLIKKVVTWEFPSLSLAFLAGLSVPAAFAVFAGALAPAVHPVVDYYVERRKLERTNAAGYLVGLSRGKEDR